MGGGGGHHYFSGSVYFDIWQKCSDILSIKFQIFNYEISLWQVMAFDIIVFLVFYWIIELSRRQ